MLRDQLGQCGEYLVVRAGGELGLGGTLQCGEPHLVQMRREPPAQPVVGDVGEQRPAPQAQRGAQGRGPLGGLGEPLRPGDLCGEPVHVDGLRVHLGEIPGTPGDQPEIVGRQPGAQPRDVRVQRGPGGWRGVVPEQVEDPLGGHHPAGLQQEQPDDVLHRRAPVDRRVSISRRRHT